MDFPQIIHYKSSIKINRENPLFEKPIPYLGGNNPLFFGGNTPKINIEPEHDGLEDDFPFPGVYSEVSC